MVSYESLKSGYERNWANLQIRPARLGEANATARKAINGKATYQQVERLTGVPWYFVALCHYRESNFDFDTQLGTAVILHAMMSQDSSITIDDSPSIASHSEPDANVVSSVLLMQQTLNKLGANPPLDEDGISGPKTKAAVSQFQQQHALED